MSCHLSNFCFPSIVVTSLDIMYPDWPESMTDLVPLPHCDGPKLKPFAFQGPPNIKFIDYLGEGLHSHVFKVQISGQIYALKLFRFCCVSTWSGARLYDCSSDSIRALYGYSEPFSCECRAFGRLHETGYEELAVRCFGYILLNEEDERIMMNQFKDLDAYSFWDLQNCETDKENMRGLYLDKGGRPPPLRGIVKEFGSVKDLRLGGVRKIFQDVIRLHQLGIINLDVAHRQLIDGKLGDFSTAITTPHIITTPELNRYLTPESMWAMNCETFRLSKDDYYDIEIMVLEWNDDCENQKDHITFRVFESSNYNQSRYQLRSTPSRKRVYSFVDPRRYDWKAFAACSENCGKRARSGQKLRRGGKSNSHGGVTSKTRPQLDARPPRWYFDCNDKVAKWLKETPRNCNLLECDVKDGLIFCKRECDNPLTIMVMQSLGQG